MVSANVLQSASHKKIVDLAVQCDEMSCHSATSNRYKEQGGKTEHRDKTGIPRKPGQSPEVPRRKKEIVF